MAKRLCLPENLPSDLSRKIFSAVDVGSVRPCKQVCKTWRSFFSHIKVGLLFSIVLRTEFLMDTVRLHYSDIDELINNSFDNDDTDNTDDMDEYDMDEHETDNISKTILKTTNYPPILFNSHFYDPIVGSCNGLVCFLVTGPVAPEGPNYIFNPVTGEYTNLPSKFVDDLGINVASGFGYLHSTNKYKVVRIYYQESHTNLDSSDCSTVGKVEVYTLGDGRGWREVGEIDYSLVWSGIFANGALHWLDLQKRVIVTFDLEAEEFRVLQPPPPPFQTTMTTSHPPGKIFRLGILGGYLCLVHQQPGDCVDIWSLKKTSKSDDCDDMKEKDCSCWSWSRKLSFKWEGSDKGDGYDIIAITKTNEVLLRHNLKKICCYDLKTAKKLWECESHLSVFQAVPHMNSSISLKDLGEESKVKTDPEKMECFWEEEG